MYDHTDKNDAKQLIEWIKANHIALDTNVHRLLEETPRYITECIRRLSFRHLEISVDDLMELCARIKDA
jgi:hypothetical protein